MVLVPEQGAVSSGGRERFMSCQWCIPELNYACRFHNGSNGSRMDKKPSKREVNALRKKKRNRWGDLTLVAQMSRRTAQPDPLKDVDPFLRSLK